MVKDINPGAGSSNLTNLTNVKGIAFFSANNGTSGVELWKSTGTTANTLLVKDIRPGAASSDPSSLVNLKGNLLFAANDGTNGNELWKSNGSAGGTTMLANIRPGVASSDPKYLTNVAGTVFFAANNGTTGAELWRSNASTTGTALIKDIRAGANGSIPMDLVNVNGTLFFSANDGVNGRELWKRQGTGGATTLVANINPGAASSNPTLLTAAGVNLFFAATTAANGNELWSLSNPTASALSAGFSALSMATPTTHQPLTLTLSPSTGRGNVRAVTTPESGSLRSPLAMKASGLEFLWPQAGRGSNFLSRVETYDGSRSALAPGKISIVLDPSRVAAAPNLHNDNTRLRRLNYANGIQTVQQANASSLLTLRKIGDLEFYELEPQNNINHGFHRSHG